MSFFTLLFPMLLAVGLYALVLWIMYLIIKTAVKNGIRDARMDPASGDWLYRVLRGAVRDALEEHAELVREAVMGELKRTFRPEFLNRIDETIIFHPLTEENIAEIARKLLAVTARRVESLGVTMTVDEEAVRVVAKEGFDPVYGARPLRRAIQSSVEDAVAEKLLEGAVKEGNAIRVTAEDGKIAIEKA